MGGWTRRRVVTVVFADLVGFTTLAEELDPEDVEHVQQRYFAAARAAVEHHGGEVEKYIGDAVVAGFGIRDRADDAALRAVRAAVDIRDAIAALDGELDQLEVPLQVRVGVDTGEVVVADAGTDWRLTGDTVNVAARLQAAARPGEVLVGPETMLAVGEQLGLEEVGPLALKGRRAPTRAWRVTASVAVAPVVTESPLVGRDLEIAELRARIAAGEAGVLVIAAPGLGRSRVLAAVVEEVVDRRVVATTVRAAGDAPYRLVGELVGAAADAPADRVADHLADLAATSPTALVGTGLRTAAAALRGEPLDAGRGELFTAWSAALEHLLPPPSLVVVDDLHLAPPDARSFVAHLVAQATPGRTVILSTRAAAVAAGDWDRFGTPLHLGPLQRAAMAAILAHLTGADVLPAALRDDVLAAAGGTPLYLVELTRRWWRDRILRQDPSGRRQLADPDAPPDVPSTIQALYTGELDDLPERPRRLVGVASVPGMAFPPEVLPTLGVPDPAPSLSALLAAGILRRDGAGPPDQAGRREPYTFRHPLVRDVAYTELLRRERAELHLRYARWLGDDAPAGEVAGHLDAALTAWPRTVADPRFDRDVLGEAAADAWERAARREVRSAPERAAERAARAAELGAADHRTRRVLLAADAQRRAGALPEAAVLLASAADLAAAAGATDDLVTAATTYEAVVHAGRVDRTSDLAARSLALLDRALAASVTDGQRTRLLAARGQARAWAGDPRGAEDLDAAIALAGGGGDPGALAAALIAARATRREPAHLGWRTDAARRAAAAAHTAGDAELGFEAERLLVIDLLEAGAWSEADAARERATGLLRDLRMPGLWWYPAMWEPMTLLRTGALDQAEAAIARFEQVARRGRYHDAAAVVRAQLLHLRVAQGRHEEALELAAHSWRRDPGRWAGPVAGAAGAIAGHDLAARDLAATALRWHLDRDLRAVPDDLSRAYILAGLAQAAVALGDGAAAVRIHALLAPWRGHVIVLGSGALCLGAADGYLDALERVAASGPTVTSRPRRVAHEPPR